MQFTPVFLSENALDKGSLAGSIACGSKSWKDLALKQYQWGNRGTGPDLLQKDDSAQWRGCDVRGGGGGGREDRKGSQGRGSRGRGS